MLAADNDLDGLFSAVILDMSLYKIFELEVETQFREELRWEIPIQDDYDILIMLDLAYDNTPNYRKASSRASQKAFAIDHHVTNESGFPQKVIAYNPCRNGECYEPTVFLVDRVAKKLGQESSDLSEYLALLGVLADAGINFRVQNKEIDYFYDSTIENLYRNGIRSYSFLFKSVEYKGFIYPKFKETIEALNAEASDVGWKELYLRFINETSDLRSAQKFIKRIENKYEGNYTEILDLIPTEPTQVSKSGIWVVRNTTQIGNGVLGRSIAELLNRACIVYSCKKTCKISARGPPESDINFIPLFSSYGGGHPRACGALVTPKKFQSFLENILSS